MEYVSSAIHAAAQQGAGSFMSGYMDLNDVPASGNHGISMDCVVSDALAAANLVTHRYASDPADAAYKAITAGRDIDIASFTLHEEPAQACERS